MNPERNCHDFCKLYNDELQDLVDVDCDIADLVQALWDVGIRTTSSCQNYHDQGLVWLDFLGQDMLQKFMNAILKGVPLNDPISKRALHNSKWSSRRNLSKKDIVLHKRNFNVKDSYQTQLFTLTQNCWTFHTFPAVIMCHDQGEIQKIEMLASVFFPKSDYEFVLKKMKAFKKSLRET